ncbi:MAG: hypothetical protein C0410_13530 [Anaerolinea sp.]|nr:hypothetical protein [Anaerolinea sp.]
MELTRTFIVNDWEVKIAFIEPEKGSTPSKTVNSAGAPGSGNYRISSMKLSAEKIAPGEALDLSVQLFGENIAFLYTEIYFKDQELDYYYGPVTKEYVRSAHEKTINGLVHPVWDSEINLSLKIKPVFHVLTDGLNAAFAFMQPVGYSQDGGQLEGLFTKKGSGNSNRARLKFDDSGELIDKRVIQEKRGRLVTHELAIKAGDQFIPAVKVLTALNLTNPRMHTLHGISGTLTKLEESFHWVDEAAIPGDYLLGLVVEDFNGDKTHHYVPFEIERKPDI